MQFARWIASTVAVILLASGMYQLFFVTPRPSTLAVALVVSGTAILYGRSWGYYIAYLAAFSCWLPPQRISLIQVASSARRFFRLYAGMEPELLYVLISALLAGLLGWSQYKLTSHLDRPMSPMSRHSIVRAALYVSLALVLLPAANFIYQLILDPPGKSVPAAPGGGMRAIYALYRTWPFVLVGLIGTCISFGILKVVGRHPENEVEDAEDS